MDWKDSVYADGSARFVSNPLPTLGEEITIQIRIFDTAPISEIILCYKKDGLEFLETMKQCKSADGFSYYSGKIEITQRSTTYHFYIVSGEKVYYYNQKGLTDYFPDEIYDFKILADYNQPSWIKGKVFYQIFPDRFYCGNENNVVSDGEYEFSGHKVQRMKDWKEEPKEFEQAFCLDFYGGDLKGIEDKIPYLKELHVNGIYLNPIFSAATVHRYDCVDYFHVDRHLGGDADFESLCQHLHGDEMRVVLDISINHTGSAHKWFNRDCSFWDKEVGAYYNKTAPEREFYYFEEGNSYGAYYGIPSLPKLNYHSAKLRDILYVAPNSVLKKWLQKPYDIDGWRFDVAGTTGQYKMDHYDHEIWKEIRNAIKEEKADAYILAEDWNDGYEYLKGDEWDAIMNFYGCGRPIREYVGQLDFRQSRKPELRKLKSNTSAAALRERIMNAYAKLPFVISENQFNMIDCHDIARLHNDTTISFEQYKIAVYLLYMLPGCVCMYYGDEVGLGGRITSTEGCRYPMNWDVELQKNPYYQLYQTMNQWKNSCSALQDGGFKILSAEGNVFACARFNEEQVVLAVTSMEQELIKEMEINLNIFGQNLKFPEQDVIGEKLVYEGKNEKVILQIPPKKGYFIVLQNI